MFNQVKKSMSFVNVIMVIMVVVLAAMAVTGFYEKASAGNNQIVANCCGGGNNHNSSDGRSIAHNNGNSYGQAISSNPAVTIKELQSNKNKYLGKTVKIEGTITEVCQHMGCWFNVNDGTGTIYVDLGMRGYFIPDDGTGPIYVDLSMGKYMTIPRDSAKSHVIVEGIVKEEYEQLSINGQRVQIISNK
ncbi:MAG: DUF4920 domain-containing protein [Candidatus Eremiobacterota bacterium]